MQTMIVYAIVAIAAGWTVWSLGLGRWVKTRWPAAAKGSRTCGPDCACGD